MILETKTWHKNLEKGKPFQFGYLLAGSVRKTDGTKLITTKIMGTSRISLTLEDGFPKYTELITSNPDGLGVGDAQQKYIGIPGMVTYEDMRVWSQLSLTTPAARQANMRTWTDTFTEKTNTPIPPAMMTEEDADEYADIMADLHTYVLESVAKFTTGEWDIDKNYDEFVNTCRDLGSDPNEVVRTSGIMIWFKGLDLYAYKEVFTHRLFMKSYANTMVYLVCGIITNMVMTTLAAYGLSRKELKGRGGLIPTYIVVDTLKMTNTLWSQFIPFAINTYNLIILRTSFQTIPDSIEEAAKIDGASPAQIMVRIVIPLALPSIMVIGLYYAVEIWNSYFRALIYLRSAEKYPLQLILRQILIANTMGQSDQAFVSTNIGLTVKYATIIVSTVPILMVYPFIQRYFVQGVMIGSIKG